MPWTSTSSPSTNWQAVSPGSVISDSLLTEIQQEAADAEASALAAAASQTAAATSASAAATSASAAATSSSAAADSEINAATFASQAAAAAAAATNPAYTTASPSISAGTLTLDLGAAAMFLVNLNANITSLVLQNVPSTGGAVASIRFTADGTQRTISWPASFRWGGAGAPTMTSTNGKVDWVQFITVNGGTTWDAFANGQNF